jgi:hypothetical protein
VGKKSFLIVSILVLLINTSCLYAIRYDSDCRGEVIDTDTGEPIEGVVVLGVWYEGYMGAGGIVHKYYDARETVTDKNGEFSLPGLGARIMSNVEPPDITVFKAGYSYNALTWKPGTLPYKSKIKWEGSKAIIPLRKLTMEERKKRQVDKETIPDKKQRQLIKELNKEYKELRIPLYPEED